MMYFERRLTEELIKWANSENRKPLLLNGARQTGKTSLLKEFGRTSFEDFAYFNFEENPDLKQFFEQTRDVKRIIQNLSLVNGTPIAPNKTLMIF